MTIDRLRRVAGVLSGLFRNEISRAVTVRSRNSEGAADREQQRATEIRQSLERLGPFYIKMGQLLSTRPDIVPENVLDELGKLHDQVSPEPFSVFEPVLEGDLGPEWKENFRDIDILEPLGAASLAQVYRVTLRDGRPGVVKIQRPGVRSTVVDDMALMRKAARLVGKQAPRFSAVVDIESMLNVLFDAMLPELDFTVEASNMRQAREAVRDFSTLSVPRVVLATQRVLVQTMAPGQSIREIDPEQLSERQRRSIGTDLLACLYRGFFVTRMFHADPHPGNIFVDVNTGRATLIDWGMVGRIDRRTSMMIMLVLLNLAQNDGHGLAKAWIELGHPTPWANMEAFESDMAALTPKVATASLAELNFGVTLTAVLQQSTKRGIKTNPMISVLGKAFANAEGSVRFLAPELSVTEVFQQQMSRIMLDLAGEFLSPKNATRVAVEAMLGLNSATTEIRSVTRDLANREFTFQVGEQQHTVRNEPHTLRNTLLGLGGAALWLHHRRKKR